MQFLYRLKSTNLKILLMFFKVNIVFSGVAKKDLVNISRKISKTTVQSANSKQYIGILENEVFSVFFGIANGKMITL